MTSPHSTSGFVNCIYSIEPPCTERYARWCERSATQLMGSLLLDLPGVVSGGFPLSLLLPLKIKLLRIQQALAKEAFCRGDILGAALQFT